jgi:hypothetical protein
MAGRHPKLTADVVREARLEREQAKRDGRRPRMKRFYVGLGLTPGAIHLACIRATYRWVA